LTEQFIFSVIGSVGVPAAILFFVLYCLNKHVPGILAIGKAAIEEITLMRVSVDKLTDILGVKPQ